jgi:hypothetical protein
MLPADGRSFNQFLARTACPEPGAAAKYLGTIPAERRAAEVNAWIDETPADTKAVFRTRLALTDTNGGDAQTSELAAYGREVYAVVSERYGTGAEVDELGRAMIAAMTDEIIPGDARGLVTYDGSRASIQALWHSNIAPERVCAGEIFKGGVTVSATDDGGLALHVDSTLHRNLCLNLLIIAQATQSQGSRRHVGNAAELLEWLYDALRRATATVQIFADMWDTARSQTLDMVTRDIPAAYLDGSSTVVDEFRPDVVRGVFRGLVKRGRLALPGHRGEASVDALFDTWKREPEFTKAGIVNAATRAAHELPLRGVWATEETETRAGAVLTSPRPFDYVERGEVF